MPNRKRRRPERGRPKKGGANSLRSERVSTQAHHQPPHAIKHEPDPKDQYLSESRQVDGWPSPFWRFWSYVNVPLSILGFAGLCDALIQWNALMAHIIRIYRSVVHTPFQSLAELLSFHIQPWMIDYLTLGTVLGALHRATRNALMQS